MNNDTNDTNEIDDTNDTDDTDDDTGKKKENCVMAVTHE
jgi:hypothetical protein